MNDNEEIDYFALLNIHKLRLFLNRDVTHEEMSILSYIKSEYNFNQEIKNLYNCGLQYNLYIPALTELSGNCFFESLQILNIIDDQIKFRNALAMAMLVFKDKKFFIKNQDLTLEELFNFTNEIECVYCTNTNKFYKYDYKAMLYDIMTDTAWTRLPTQIIIMVIATLLNIKFVILHNNSHITELGESEEIVYLGLVDEMHYIPLKKQDEKYEINNIPLYMEKFNLFKHIIDKNIKQKEKIEEKYETIYEENSDSKMVDF